jgi:hypothetical protein
LSTTTNPIFWPGSGSAPSGLTPLGLYDDEDKFNDDAPKVATWVATRLGYPIMSVEMTDAQLYACFEEAISEYSAQVNEFNMRDNMMAIQGAKISGSISQKLITGSPVRRVISLSDQYGTEAGVGGNVDWKRGYIDTTTEQQEYDLQALWGAVSESGNRIEIRRVFHDRSPAIARGGFGVGDATTGPNDGSNYLLGEFGWAGYDGGLNATGGATTGQFMLMPIFETILRTQAIEFNDQIRRSQYSFELINNKIKLFPSPSGERLWFQYTVKQDAEATAISTGSGVISDYSNAPYSDIPYANINDVGLRWIRKYTLALAKESLGRILSKYESLPIPNAEVRLDGPTLRQESAVEKDTLWQQLRETLEETGRAKQMEKMAQNEEKAQDILRKAPLYIYVG